MSFNKILKGYKEIIDKELELFINSKIKKGYFLKINYDFIREFVLNGGKRLRPVLAIMTGKALGCDAKKILPFALLLVPFYVIMPTVSLPFSLSFPLNSSIFLSFSSIF